MCVCVCVCVCVLIVSLCFVIFIGCVSFFIVLAYIFSLVYFKDNMCILTSLYILVFFIPFIFYLDNGVTSTSKRRFFLAFTFISKVLKTKLLGTTCNEICQTL